MGGFKLFLVITSVLVVAPAALTIGSLAVLVAIAKLVEYAKPRPSAVAPDAPRRAGGH